MRSKLSQRSNPLKALAAAGIVPVTLRSGTGRMFAAQDLVAFDLSDCEVPELHQAHIAKCRAWPMNSMHAVGDEVVPKLEVGFGATANSFTERPQCGAVAGAWGKR
jgi:hypothetical protein